MRFQYLFSVSFLAAALAPVLAVPLAFGSSDISSLETRDFADDGDIFLRESLDIEERDMPENLAVRDFLDSLVPRAKTYTPKKPVVKKTAAQAKARKDTVRHNVHTSQVANAAKKAHLQAQPVPKYGKPRKPGKPNVRGFRAKGRETGHRLEKQPKTPKPNMVKGQAKSDKATRTQAAAIARKKTRLADGKTKFQDAAKAHKATVGLPGRKDKFHVNGEHTYSGKDVRVANFNSHLFKATKDNVGGSPKPFRNDEQGPPGAKTRPIPSMHGEGHEFPLTAGKRGGYQGGEKSAARLITQDHTNEHGAKVTKFAGVIAHDVSKKEGDKGYNDHFQVHPTVHHA